MSDHHHHEGDELDDGQAEELDDGQAEELDDDASPPPRHPGRRAGRRRSGWPWDMIGNSGP